MWRRQMAPMHIHAMGCDKTCQDTDKPEFADKTGSRYKVHERSVLTLSYGFLQWDGGNNKNRHECTTN